MASVAFVAAGRGARPAVSAPAASGPAAFGVDWVVAVDSPALGLAVVAVDVAVDVDVTVGWVAVGWASVGGG